MSDPFAARAWYTVYTEEQEFWMSAKPKKSVPENSLQIEHLAALFGEEAESIHSSLLVPFRFLGNEALLAVGSTEWNQYRQSVDLDVLTTVIEIVSHRTEPTAA